MAFERDFEIARLYFFSRAASLGDYSVFPANSARNPTNARTISMLTMRMARAIDIPALDDVIVTRNPGLYHSLPATGAP